MTQEEKRIKIAEACGWSSCQLVYDDPMGRPPNTSDRLVIIPNYFGCLNAIHEAEKTLLLLDGICGYWETYSNKLAMRLGCADIFHATAAQRGEVFGLTLELW